MTDIPDILVTTHLHMTSSEQFRPAHVDRDDLLLMQMQIPDLDFYRFLYRTVGEHWRWRDRLLMEDEALRQILAADTTHVHVLYSGGVPAGYVELEQQGDDVEVAYFGLRPLFIGQGLGKHLLSYGLEQAWQLKCSRVWVHTCNLDGPHALGNYQARGFVVCDVVEEPMPDRYL